MPDILPVFPLTGVLLLPGMRLPLHVFEPRYRNMVVDALAGGRHIGMIQPVTPRQDNGAIGASRQALGAGPGHPPPQDTPGLYPVGCAGVIEDCRKQEDGRYLLTLVGVSRFRCKEELPPLRGYRRVVADYGGYEADVREPPEPLDTHELLAALKAYGDRYSVSFDVERLRGLPSPLLVNGLAMSLPFRPAEKQVLLEAATLAERQRLVLGLMGMGLASGAADGFYTPPTLN
ncbi:MAG: LON peptidase substrate-binding domain-containing protein [Opitutales bacterium]